MATSSDRCGFMFMILFSLIPILVSGYFLIDALVGDDPHCDHLRVEWDIRFFAFLVALFAFGTIGVIGRLKSLQIICIAVLVSVIASIVVMSWNIEFDSNRADNLKRIDPSYRLDTYPGWVVKFLLKDKGWSSFRNCLNENNVCEKKLDDNYFKENGCCVPPLYCGYREKNQTWIIPASGLFADDANCIAWNSDKTKLCHQCETCQAVYVYILTFQWNLRGIMLMFGVIVLGSCLSFTYEYEHNQRRQQQQPRT
ncbi:hypothetical protein Vadar_025041 [Vaccinium darrowii]|uniref:Uncharacterized protein n=1 Tax=Vaccinium darrowii TaxID=229202 RepID=A0ACB7Y2E4_9ERIC|nr:hypothetical protein Vadar_025041 [Vaccinium darrowii]